MGKTQSSGSKSTPNSRRKVRSAEFKSSSSNTKLTQPQRSRPRHRKRLTDRQLLTPAEMALDASKNENEEGDDHDDADDDEEETQSNMDRLARQFSPEQEGLGDIPEPPTSNVRTLRSAHIQSEGTETVLPTIENYRQLVDEWPPARIAVQDRSQKKKGTAVPPKILTEAEALQTLYKQHKSLLAIMGNVSMFTLNKALGELGGCRRPSGYQIWLKFGKEIEKHRKRMPRKWGQKGVLASQNKILGDLWTGLPDEHKEVFSPPVFHSLSGLRYSQNGKRLEINDDANKDAIEFEPGEREELQALYDQIVWKEKVAKEYSMAAKGVVPGPTLPDYNRQSLKAIERIKNQIENESNNMGFDYYLIACSKHALTEAHSSSIGWCKEYTSIEEMLKYVNKKSNFATMFAARAQGLSAGEIIADTIGRNHMLSEKPRKADPGDLVKSQLALAMRTRMTALLGYEIGFPRGPDPAGILLDKYNIKIIQMPGSKLQHEALKLGFNAMNSRRSLWLDDVKANLFKLEKIDAGEEQENDDNIMDIDEEVTNTQQDVLIDDDLVEDEEWTGLGDME